MKNLKKITLIAACALFGTVVSAQDEATDQEKPGFNRWSIELNAGVHKPLRPLSGGYFTTTPDFFQGDLGVRYMLSDRFGLKLDGAYHNIQGDDNSADFESRYIRTSLQGVANLGNILNFDQWTGRFNVLVHGGAGYSVLTPKEPMERDNDGMINFIAGITPQLRLSDRVALTGDVSAIAHARQDYTFDGTSNTNVRGIDGIMTNASIGFTFYLGNKEKHADWTSQEDGISEQVNELVGKVDKIESDMQDTDRDGVADYLDEEPNTVSGVAVNTKGVAVDKNENGIPDELEDALDERYATDGKDGASAGNTIKKLLNEGYVNVYFQFNSTKLESNSINAVNYLVKYLKDNESANVELVGYADAIGDAAYNDRLSEKRAKTVQDILVASGIDESRLSHRGAGEDDSVDKSSSDARHLMRRVTFKLE